MRVASGNAATIDHFSIEQVRTLATDIIEECKLGGGKGWGHGGLAPIGRGLGWTVAVSGFALEGVGSDGSMGSEMAERGMNG